MELNSACFPKKAITFIKHGVCILHYYIIRSNDTSIICRKMKHFPADMTQPTALLY